MKESVITLVLISISSVSAAVKPTAAGVVDPYGIIKKPIPDKTVVLTFDDACRSHATFVAPLLKEYGFGGTFYITEAFGFKTRKDWYMTWEQIKLLQDMGFEVGNHTINHQSCSAVSPEQCLKNIEALERDFKKHGLARSTTFCYPMSRVNNAFLPVLREHGYLFARNGRGGDDGKVRAYDPVRDSPLHVPAFGISDVALKKQPDVFFSAAKQAKAGKIAVFMFHGVPDKEHPGCSLEPEKFKEMMEYLKKNRYNVIALRDVAEYVDVGKAALYLSRRLMYPWGSRALPWGWISQKDDMLYIGISKVPADRKLTLPGLTTKIAQAWLLADKNKRPLSIATSHKGISTITVPEVSPEVYGSAPVMIAAELQGGPVATILDFGFPGLPEVTMSKDEITAVVPEATDLKALTPVYKTGSPEVTGQPASGTARNFTSPQKYTIRSRDGKSKTYTVKVTKKRGAVGIANPSFETFDPLKGKYGAVDMNPTGAFWVFKKNHPNSKVGIKLGDRFEQPDGTMHCGFVQGAGSSLSQSVMFDKGKYTISFDRRGINWTKVMYPSLNLVLDDRVLLTLEAYVKPRKGQRGQRGKKVWTRHTSPVFSVSAGLHTISFVIGDDADPYSYGLSGANLIDNVRIEYKGK